VRQEDSQRGDYRRPGPDPDEDGNPPGRVFFCVASRRHAPVIVQNHFTEEDPDEVRRAVLVRGFALLGETVEA
jgi:nicotinamide mononucleotide (NMN) deamidase PncC